jgi:hypothetical protein
VQLAQALRVNLAATKHVTVEKVVKSAAVRWSNDVYCAGPPCQPGASKRACNNGEKQTVCCIMMRESNATDKQLVQCSVCVCVLLCLQALPCWQSLVCIRCCAPLPVPGPP